MIIQPVSQNEKRGMYHIPPLAVSAHLSCSEGRLSLFSLHEHTINLINDSGNVITLHCYGSGFSPMGLVLKTDHFEYIKSIITINNLPLWQLANGDLVIGDMQLIYHRRQCTLDAAYFVPSCINKKEFIHFLEQIESLTGLFGPLKSNVFYQQKPQLLLLCQHIEHLMQSRYADLTSLIGLGPGLTPSFDDTLVGMMAILSTVPQFSSQLALLQQAILTLPLTSLTTKISAAFLQYASQSKFSMHILQVIYAINRNKYDHISMQNMLNYGHTSGADLLLGIWLGIDYFISED